MGDHPMPIPTKPGAYYRADGGAALCVPSSIGDLDVVSIGVGGHGYARRAAADVAWAPDLMGGAVEVPTLDEWQDVCRQRDAILEDLTAARADLQVAEMEIDAMTKELDRLTAELRAWADKEATTCTCGSGGHPRPCDVHPDRYAAHCAELSAEAAYDELQELLTALAVPSHADSVEWAALLARGAALVDRREDGPIAFPGVEWAREVIALRTPPRPLPDAPGQWWGRLPGGAYRAVDVVHCDGLVARLAWTVDDLPLDGFAWLAGPDGKAVRCVPPGGGE